MWRPTEGRNIRLVDRLRLWCAVRVTTSQKSIVIEKGRSQIYNSKQTNEKDLGKAKLYLLMWKADGRDTFIY